MKKNTIHMFNYYKWAVIYPSLFAILNVFIFTIVDYYISDHKSEWLAPESIIFITVLFSIIYCFIGCLLALPIFLNSIEKFRANQLYIFLSWFALPVGVFIFTFFDQLKKTITIERELNSDLILMLVLNLPFVIGLVGSYLLFRKRVLT